MPRRSRLLAAVVLVTCGMFLGAAALASTQVRSSLKGSALGQWLNSPLVRRVDAQLFNLRHALLTPAELGDGGPVRNIKLLDPMGLARDSAGNLYVTDRGGPGSGRVVWRLGIDGRAAVIAGTGRRGVAVATQSARQSSLGSPQGLCLDRAGRVYFADSYNHLILQIGRDGSLNRIGGTGRPGSSGDGGPAAAATLNQPYDVRSEYEGNLYIADYGNHRIRKITPDGIMLTVAGSGQPGYSGDGGKATESRLNGPYGVYPLPGGGFLIADSHNNVMRLVDGRGHISTLAGSGERGYSGDGDQGSRARFDSPQGLFRTRSGAIIIGDEHNHAIRSLEPDGTVRHLAGTGTAGFSPDGAPAAAASLNDPENIVEAEDGSLFFTEAGTARIRRIGPDGTLTTLAGGR